MLKITSLLFALIILSGCVLTKVVTVPMRITGAVISVIPVVGESVDAGLIKRLMLLI